ncbi:nitroreductase/quinone reductase family protein [Pseudonocardia nigra]|uniref:nitroreductase/quinone reductase family protein n=1 Tax=Pseudonocardia nigra TaxID=1921578 RepID=UPI001C5F80BF|nr:nitroreductase/quinone reductase family protein [Pseudonocardia nigra]
MAPEREQWALDTNRRIIEEFRAGGGQVGGPFAGAPLVLVTTIGARTGLPRTSPAMYLADDDRILVFASNAGAPQHPAWYHNMVANPEVVVEIGRDGAVETRRTIATVLQGAERDRFYARQAELVPAFADYQAGTSRLIPVIALRPAPPGGGEGRAGAAAQHLAQVHAGLRADLAALRAQVADGAPDLTLGQDLLRHCLTFCGAMETHHGRENGVFPDLERRFPELGPALDRLRREHVVVAAVVGELRTLTTTTTADRTTLRVRLEELANELETHFDYEEAQLGPALDAIGADH